MLLLGQHNDVVATWVGQRLECVFSPPYTTIARLAPDGTLIAGAVFSAYSGSNVELSLYAPGRAFQRQFWRAVLRYPFEDLRVLRVTTHSRRSNKWTIAQLRKFATFEGVQKRFFGPLRSDDAFVFGIFPDHPLVRLYTHGEGKQTPAGS